MEHRARLLTYRQTAEALGDLDRIEIGPWAVRFDAAQVSAIIERGRGRRTPRRIGTAAVAAGR
jgi:hypothetical protein